eukprot:9460463-Alexandrium_andersonii.AAC.1
MVVSVYPCPVRPSVRWHALGQVAAVLLACRAMCRDLADVGGPEACGHPAFYPKGASATFELAFGVPFWWG